MGVSRRGFVAALFALPVVSAAASLLRSKFVCVTQEWHEKVRGGDWVHVGISRDANGAVKSYLEGSLFVEFQEDLRFNARTFLALALPGHDWYDSRVFIYIDLARTGTSDRADYPDIPSREFNQIINDFKRQKALQWLA